MPTKKFSQSYYDYQDLWFGPRIGSSFIIDQWGADEFLTIESFPLEKTLINFEMSQNGIVRLKNFGQTINSLSLLPFINWHIYLNGKKHYLYQAINILLGSPDNLGEIIIFEKDIQTVKVTAECLSTPTADTEVSARILGWYQNA